MKTFVFLLGLSTCLFSANAQLTKKNWLVGGSGKFSSITSTSVLSNTSVDSKYTLLTFSPNIGYFILDKFAIGLKSSINWEKSISYSPGYSTSNQTNVLAGPFLRYYFLKSDNTMNFLLEPSFQYGPYRAGDEKGNSNIFSALTGPVIFFNSSVGLEILAGYSFLNLKTGRQSAERKTFLVSIGFQIHLENE